MSQPTESKFSGTAIYRHKDNPQDNPQHEMAATLNVCFTLEDRKLQGNIQFRGHQSWKSNFDIEGVHSALPELWKLKAHVRDRVRGYMKDHGLTCRFIEFPN